MSGVREMVPIRGVEDLLLFRGCLRMKYQSTAAVKALKKKDMIFSTVQFSENNLVKLWSTI